MTRLLIAVSLLLATSLAVPSTKGLKSDVTIIVDNDLQGQDSPNADAGVLLLSRRQSYDNAVASCKALGEELWVPQKNHDGLDAALSRVNSMESIKNDEKFWIASDGAKHRAVSRSGSMTTLDKAMKLPVLCTQSAPYSNTTKQDTDEQWQIDVQSNGETLTGFRDHLSFRFLGVRYAAEPKRFTYSTPYHGDGKTVSAVDYGSQCMQYGSGSEDCLFLNIWTPHLPRSHCSTKDLKPVMFWIHGGAFTGGTANDETFDGGNIASRGDVVLVAINYRLSTLGFLALDDGVTNGNFGFADQILALDWVRDNIRDFGGDPDRITVFGQSAGAGSVRAMMASPKALGKFSGAIPMSNLGGLAYGTTYSKYYTIEEEVEAAANDILKSTNCTDAASQVDCLRTVDAGTLTTLPTVARFMVVDGTYLTKDELKLSGPKLPLSLMMGIAAQDGTPFITFTPDVTANNTDWLTSQGLPYPPRDLFPLEDLKNQTLAVDRLGSRVATDAIFRCIDQATVYAGLQRGVFDKVYYYEFERTYQIGWPGLDLCEPPVTPGHPFGNPEAKIGYDNCHSGEILYVFGNVRRSGLPYRDAKGDAQFEKEVLDRWAAFAWGRNPNIKSGPEDAEKWEPSVKEEMKVLVLDWPTEHMAGFRDLEQCRWLGLPLDYYL